MNIQVVKPGLQTTIQDLGRIGYMSQGVSVTGAMDTRSLRIANMLVGNAEHEAVLEMTMTGPSLKFDEEQLIAVTGGGMLPVMNGKRLHLNTPLFIPAGSLLHFEPLKKGCRAYLSIAGGYDVPVVMGSKSTYLRAGIGGYKGRALKKGDTLTVHPMSKDAKQYMNQLSNQQLFPKWRVSNSFVPNREQTTIRVLKGTHFDRFTEESQNTFFDTAFQISSQSDRMGYRLDTDQHIELSEPFELLSEAVTLGTVQLPPGGKPIILLADRQSTGGYPRIAQVMIVDIPKLAQLKPGESVLFEEVSLQEAEQIYIQAERDIAEIKAAISLKGVKVG
ncbi:5-oxoprolinase subunit C family protein [Alkalicoccobacillus murimartini]|uniref:Antagonist of KipI n=1 Tax=Alkalicoccobacillus murimartini TaxID=171685 RepID=A0ABT9YL81_9BACI|nr:biotin-dependent carboxyltransferase family protein [Alkalicoccobacillus murimartini]MDQ0208230.1 antagonist of KipI [Alkalicoccobacillus murimartini]